MVKGKTYVNVLRGPQGTIYGRNSETGIINVVTRKPSSQWESKGSPEAGSFNIYDFIQGYRIMVCLTPNSGTKPDRLMRLCMPRIFLTRIM